MAALGFIPARDRDAFNLTPGRSSGRSSNLSGEEVRRFYEDLMKDGGTQEEPTNSSRDGSRRRTGAGRVRRAEVQTEAGGGERTQELRGLRLLRCAHQGDIRALRELLSVGVDVNFQDAFLWTAVMCASWSGHKAAVRLLLNHGAAWVGVVDTSGRDAQDLALEAGHKDVLEELLSFGQRPQTETPSYSSLLQPQWCDVCCCEYRSSPSSHLSSTLHQFSLRRPQPTPYYCLPPSSNGYKMMVRCGWRPGSGLGPEADGTKQPVSTVLKRDQKGLGFEPTKRAKVTHFRAGDRDAVKHQRTDRQEKGWKGQKKDQIKRKEVMDKIWERDFRTSFYQ